MGIFILRNYLFLFVFFFQIQAYAYPLDKDVFLSALKKGAPNWMETQIKKDLKAFQSGIPTKMVDDLFMRFDPENNHLVRFKVINNQLFEYHPFDYSHGRLSAYRQALLFFIETVGLPDLDLGLTLHDHFIISLESPIPIMAYGRNDRLSQAILIPDYIALSAYQNSLDGHEVNDNVWNAIDWKHKEKKAFWRGSTTGGFFNRENWSSFPRTKLALLSLQHPQLLDAKITGICQAEEDISQILAEHDLLGNRISIQDHLQYRYLVDVDGNGWTVPRCFWILLSNSLLLKQKSDWILWYSAGLIPYKHYLPISKKGTDIFDKIKWAKGHDKQAKRMAKQATHFAKNDLSLANTYLYFYKLLCEYAKLQKH